MLISDRQANLSTKHCFERANCKFNHEKIPNATKENWKKKTRRESNTIAPEANLARSQGLALRFSLAKNSSVFKSQDRKSYYRFPGLFIVLYFIFICFGQAQSGPRQSLEKKNKNKSKEYAK